MLYDPSTNSALHAWLVKTLEPICDAEPEALATYIVALLKHDGPENELRKEVTEQLDEFFENGAASFIDTLFATLRSKSYIPYTTSSSDFPPKASGSGDVGIPIPIEALITPSSSAALERGTKRSLDSNEPDLRGPPKGPRLSREGDRRQPSGPYDRTNVDYPTMGGSVMQPYQTPNGRPMLPKGVCRDYHLKGFCSRGELCKFSHDDIGFTPQLNMAMNGGGMPFMMNMYGAMPFGMLPGQSSSYDPNDARMDMNTYQQGPTISSGRNGMNGGPEYNSQGEVSAIQDLTPVIQADDVQRTDTMGTSVPSASSFGSLSGFKTNSPQVPGTNGSPPQGSSLDHSRSYQHNASARGGNTGFRGRGRGGHGTFGGHQSFNEELENGRSIKTIVVEKIPDEHLSLEAVNGWFKRFGTVTNVAVDAKGKKALVSFSTREEARAAWAAEEAVFNNRFVKIFWHRPMEGQGTAGARALQASAPLVANMSAREKDPAQATKHVAPPASGSISSPKPTPTSNSSALQSKEELLAKRIAEQKELMGKLSTSTGEEKKQIMTRLRALNAEMKAASLKQTSPEDHSRQSSQAADDAERRKRELLDAELDMHAKGTGEETPVDDEETTEQLREKLAKLRAEASALGITDVMSPGQAPSYRGGFRGRVRGRAAYRGAMRGGPLRSSMKLDNRTKSLLVKGVSSNDEAVMQSVRSWFETTGQLSSLEVNDDESFVATFASRMAAEQALGKGANIPSVGAVKLLWYNETSSAKTPASMQPTLPEKKISDDHPSPKLEVSEETGWGNEEDLGRF